MRCPLVVLLVAWHLVHTLGQVHTPVFHHGERVPDGDFVSLIQLQAQPDSSNPHGTNTTEPRTIKGQITLNHIRYNTVCDCHDALASAECVPPRRLKVHKEVTNSMRGFSRQDLQALLGRPRDIPMLDVDRTSFSCVDGRDPHTVIATPGGDFGEFLTALSVAEDILGKNLTQVDVKETLQHYLAHIDGSFFYCTDEAAITNLQQNLHVNGETGVVLGLRVEEPKGEYKVEILKDVVNPMNQGDYFLKAVLTDSAKFFIRMDLARHAVRALHEVMWDKETKDVNDIVLASKVRLAVYQGEPKEKAWLNFVTSEQCDQEHRAPGFAPKGKVFVNHPIAVRVLRQRFAVFLKARLGLPLPSQEVFARFDRQGARNMEMFAEIRGLQAGPFYTVTAL